MMTPVAFERSLSQAAPPSACSPALQAMWWAAKDDWNAADAFRTPLNKYNRD
jgi:hypothetical protein